MFISQKTTNTGPTIEQQSIYFDNIPFTVSKHSFVNLTESFFKKCFAQKVRFLSEHEVGLLKRVSTTYETSSYSSELVKLFIKSGEVNVSLILISFLVEGLRYFAITFEALHM